MIAPAPEPDISKPAVSVALATYNGECFIAEQLRSLLAQTVSPMEIVICDDRSTDNTLDIVESIARESAIPIRVFSNPQQLGYRRNFLKAGALCRGDLIFFCDQDDIWETTKLAVMAPIFDDPSVMLAYHNATVFFSDPATPSRALYDDAEQQRSAAAAMPNAFHFSQGFTQAYRRDLHRFDRLWDLSVDQFAPNERLAHDQWFFFLAHLLGEVRYSAEKLARYRQHGANVFGAHLNEKTPRRQRPASIERANEMSAFAAASSARARIAAEIAGEEHHARSALLSRQYSDFARMFEKRFESATAVSVWARSRALVTNIAEGAYWGRSPWRFRIRWLPGDLYRTAVGVTPARSVQGSPSNHGT